MAVAFDTSHVQDLWEDAVEAALSKVSDRNLKDLLLERSDTPVDFAFAFTVWAFEGQEGRKDREIFRKLREIAKETGNVHRYETMDLQDLEQKVEELEGLI